MAIRTIIGFNIPHSRSSFRVDKISGGDCGGVEYSKEIDTIDGLNLTVRRLSIGRYHAVIDSMGDILY